jgi:arsenate reductase
VRITIYHNPGCSNSRETLAILREQGIAPEIVEYLNTPLSKDELRALIAKLDIPVRDLLREKEAAYAELDLANPAKSDDELLDAIVAHPILMNRPVVVTPLGARLCRPPEKALEILPDTRAVAGKQSAR